MALGTKSVGDLNFIEIFLAIILAWVLVSLWHTAIRNLMYRTFCLDKTSTFHTFIVAILFTLLFCSFIFTIGDVLKELIIGSTSNIAGGLTPAPPTTSNS